VKRFVIMNPAPAEQPDAAPPPPVPPVDYLDIEASLQRRFPAWQSGSGNATPRVSDVPFQMFAYRLVEKERNRAAILHIGGGGRDKASDSSSDGNSLCGDESGSATLSDADALSVSSRGTTTTRSLPDRAGSRKASPRKVDGSKVASRLAGKPSVHAAPR